MSDLLAVIKKAATEAVNAGEPVGVTYGTVATVKPLSIFLDQKLTLDSDFLILTKNVTDYAVEMTDETSVKKTYIVHNALKVDDKVIMIKSQGGQEYIVLDKIGGAT